MSEGGDTVPRVRPGRLRETGLLPQLVARVLGRRFGLRPLGLFLVLGRHRPLFRAWLLFSSRLLRGTVLTRREVELVILRVATARDCAYELDHHRRLAGRAGITDEELDHLRTGSSAPWAAREKVLLQAVEELHHARDVTDDTWAALRAHFPERAAIEICLLAGHYELLATTITTLRLPLDQPRGRVSRTRQVPRETPPPPP
ncbi:carboxymuconolactone decarboxylase family protein [Actinophytocola sp.]|uniref:carboxymuconolactone decarboxylase family protein n=1 Tax=Actinophytocola sp. TaxID=1872138 RepID=UPI002D3DA98F|nr:carboxymuconolactone decarboxylase family protein [Actinophytocola sp.]HYQ64035.1 carboxymuconolactone decarboxylase family protein [Actinophytocola sp.]